MLVIYYNYLTYIYQLLQNIPQDQLSQNQLLQLAENVQKECKFKQKKTVDQGNCVKLIKVTVTILVLPNVFKNIIYYACLCHNNYYN